MSAEEIVAEWEAGKGHLLTHEIDVLIEDWRKRGDTLESIANRAPWKGRENYDRGDEGLADYWSDVVKEFRAAARAALGKGDGSAQYERESEGD